MNVLFFDIASDFKTDFYITDAARRALHTAAEAYAVGLFEDAAIEAVHRASETIGRMDVQLSRRVRGERS